MNTTTEPVLTMSLYTVLGRGGLCIVHEGRPVRFGLRAEAEQFMDAHYYPRWRDWARVVQVEAGGAGRFFDGRA